MTTSTTAQFVPTFDEHDDPSDEALTALETFEGTAAEFFEAAESLWSPLYGTWRTSGEIDWQGKPVTRIRITTGGWSGCEAVVAAMRNSLAWALFWSKSARGGLHEFLLPVDQERFRVSPLSTPARDDDLRARLNALADEWTARARANPDTFPDRYASCFAVELRNAISKA